MSATENTIEDAIENMKIITFDYDGYTRRVEPHHSGILVGATQLHGYQISNGSNGSQSGQLPEWRNFKLENISNLSIDNGSTFSERSDYNPDNSNYSNIIKSVRSYPLPRP